MANNDLVNSLLKGLDIIRLVGSNDNGMRLGEIAEGMGLKTPATHNLVRTLLARGFLEKRNGNRLYIGQTMLDIAGRRQNSALAAAAEKELQHLHEVLPPGVVVFGQTTPQEIRQLFRISFDRPHVLQRLSGDVFHLYASASGLVGLAFATESAKLMMEERHPFAEYGAHLWQSRARLEEFLAEVKRTQVAICPFDHEMFFRVSVPVFDSSRRMAGVIGASIPTANLKGLRSREEIINQLKTAAARLGGEGK